MLHSPSFASQYASWIDVDSWVDMVLINEFSRDMDSYVRSTYFHKDREAPIVAGPMWDHDLTFGVGASPTTPRPPAGSTRTWASGSHRRTTGSTSC